MNSWRDDDPIRRRWRLVLRVSIVVLIVVLTVALSRRLGQAGQVALAGSICLFGMAITAALLAVFVRQYYDTWR